MGKGQNVPPTTPPTIAPMLVLLLPWLGGFASWLITLPGGTMDVTVITEVMACPLEVILRVMELVRATTKNIDKKRKAGYRKKEKKEESNGHRRRQWIALEVTNKRMKDAMP
jgi:hypothetical protein